MFAIVDGFIQEIRERMKMLEGKDACESHVYEENINPGKPKVALVKQVAGQGRCMICCFIQMNQVVLRGLFYH